MLLFLLNGVDVNVLLGNGLVFIYVVVFFGYKEMVDILLLYGVDLNIRIFEGFVFLYIVVE